MLMAPVATIKIFLSKTNSVFRKDWLVKLICIPVLAVSISNFCNIITNTRYNAPHLFLNYACFILLAWIIWQGNVRLLVFLKKNINLPFKQYYKSILILYAFIMLYTALIASSGLLLWLAFSNEDKTAYKNVFTAVVIIIVSALFITNLYEIFYLKEQQQDIEKRAEQLNVAKTHAELVALKNQIDPHFLFNSLNTLSYLISSDPVNARLYNDTLARVYRYILINREKNLISVGDEIEFLSNFFYLLRIRFDNAIDMIIEMKSVSADELFLPPISLQILLENAIKHNELSIANPLKIYVTVSSNHITLKNRIIQKTYSPPSTGTGLNNLDNRYKLLTGKNIIVYKNNEAFTVKLPLINPQA
ncbi:MAG: histidine kinase [Parafilimonas sp.]|nr:histidine kinase [Parafilimonas sp.]